LARSVEQIAGRRYQDQLAFGQSAVTVGTMQARRGKGQSRAGRLGRWSGLLSLLCVLLLMLAAGLSGPAMASDRMELPPISAHPGDGDSGHCLPDHDSQGMAPSCASIAGCAAFLSSEDVRLSHSLSPSGGLPSLDARLHGQFLPPLTQPPEYLLRL